MRKGILRRVALTHGKTRPEEKHFPKGIYILMKEIKSAGRYGWMAFVGLLICVQGIILCIDHHPMFFLGDSASYIWTAISGWFPTDRSFVYGYFIRLVAFSTQSLHALVVVQVLLICVAAVIMAHLLIRYFHVKPWISFALAILTSLEPLQMLYGRYVMTETLALAVFVFYVWLVIHYFEDPQIKWLGIIQGIAVLLISIRFAFIPIVWVCAPMIPVLALPSIADKARLDGVTPVSRIVLHLLVSVALLFLLTSSYKQLHGFLQHKPAAYSYDSGFFAMGFVLPILEPEDFTNETMGHKVLNDLRFPLLDPRFRAPQRWMEGGAVNRLQKIEPDRLKSEAIARHVVMNALIRNPFAYLQLGWHTFKDYFDSSYLRSCMETDLGNVKLDKGLHNLIKTHFHYAYDQSSALDFKMPTGRYFLHSERWIQFLLFVPLGWGLLFLFMRDSGQRLNCLFMGLISFLLVMVAVFLVERPTPRFLHIPAWLFSLMTGVGLNRLIYRKVPKYAE